LYRVSRSEAVADYPEVLQKIAANGRDQDATPAASRAYRVLKEDESAVREDPEELLARTSKAFLLELSREDRELYEYCLSAEEAFSARWDRVGRYWLNLLFESAYFACLSVFAFWPWLRRKGVWSWCIHVGLLPMLLFAPWYLGYAGWTFTSAGPSGGVLYPWVIVWFRRLSFWTPVDSWILENVPRLLEPISQPLGPMLSISGGRGLGPVGALVLGLVLSGVTSCVFWLRERRRSSGSGPGA
jgi:hypothetical protein